MYTWIFGFFTVFLKNRNISSKIKRSKVTDYAALNVKKKKQLKNFHFYRKSLACIYLQQVSLTLSTNFIVTTYLTDLIVSQPTSCW